jgi:subtilisin family serine protease
MRRSLLVSLLFVSARTWSAGLEVPLGLYPHFQRFVQREGAAYGLALDANGATLVRPGVKNSRLEPKRLAGDPLYRLVSFIEPLPDGSEEARLAAALREFLAGREKRDESFERTLFDRKDPARLTPLGRSIIVDILTAEDGLLFEETPEFKELKLELEKSKPAPWAEQPSLADRRMGIPIPAVQAAMAPSTSAVVSSYIRMLGFDSLWAAGMTGAGVSVGILDTGADLSHSDLRGRVLAYENLTFEVPGDIDGHGTHVSGIVAGGGDGAKGAYPGGAPGAELAVFKTIHEASGTNKAGAEDDDSVAAMQHIQSMPPGVRPKVVNASFGGKGGPRTDPVSQMASELTLKHNILVVASAGNDGPKAETIEAPANAAYILTVGAVSPTGKLSYYSARGPVTQKFAPAYTKPDVLAVGGGESFGACGSAPDGVVAPRSSSDTEKECAADKDAKYRYMSGTSMASPMGSAVAADVVGYLLWRQKSYQAVEVKAVIEETAHDLGRKPEEQGAGLIDGKRLADVVRRRVATGLPIGNLAYMLAVRLTSLQRGEMAKSGRWKFTPIGVLDRRTGRMLHTDDEINQLASWLEKSATRRQ